MLFKNSVKILFSNFKNVWKSMLYFLCVFVSLIFLIYLAVRPVYDLLVDEGFVQGVIDVYANFMKTLNLEDLLMSVKTLGGDFLGILKSNIGNIWICFVCIFLIVFVLNVILSNLAIMVNCNSLSYYMGSMNEQGFYMSFKEVFAKNLKVTIIHYFVSLPFKVLTSLCFVYMLKLFSVDWLWSMAVVFIIVCGMVMLFAFNVTLFSAWVPTMVIMNYGVWKSLKISLKTVFKRFGRVYGCAVGFVLLLLSVNLFLGLFTFGVGLLVSVPAFYMFYSAIGMVVGFEGQGMRYYVDIYNVITSTKKENTDKLVEMKYIV